jgi:DNA modification methylase
MVRKNFINRLNDLSSKDWIKFQKSWFIHNPSPRNREVLRHPAKFPETLAQEFIEFFTKREQVVLDPMAGTGSTLVAALRCGRNSYGIELNPNYVEIANQVIAKESDDLGLIDTELRTEMITGDAAHLPEIVDANNIPIIDYVLTSPPYWNMLHSRGAETQRDRRKSIDLDVIYSNNPNDLGNIEDYDEFLERLIIIYQGLKPFLKPRAYLTIIVKNIKKGGRIYPLAWDLADKLCHTFQLKDERIWCQDNQRLAPYGIGNAWVSNTFHHYCLQFRNEL